MQLVVGDWQTLGEAARDIRFAVFVAEQGVPQELEWDEFDACSLHGLLRSEGGEALATGRLLPDGHIGRLAVLAAWRKQGLGRRLMACLMEHAQQRGLAFVLVNAQLAAADFYRRLGFVAEGEAFMDAGIAHQCMRHVF